MTVDRVSQLWALADGRVFGVLDGAAHPDLVPRLLGSRLWSRCLLRPKPPEALLLAAPHLVTLEPGHALTEWLLEEGWGRAWGVYLTTQAGPKQLLRHLRGLLTASTSRGELLLRFWDPRVLPLLLTAIRAQERDGLFGPVARFFSEGADDFRVHAREEGPEHAAAPPDPVAEALQACYPSPRAASSLAAAAGLEPAPHGGALWRATRDEPARAGEVLRLALLDVPGAPPLLAELARRSEGRAAAAEQVAGRLLGGAADRALGSLEGERWFPALATAFSGRWDAAERAALRDELFALAVGLEVARLVAHLPDLPGIEAARAAVRAALVPLEERAGASELGQALREQLDRAGRAGSARTLRAGLVLLQAKLRVRGAAPEAGRLAARVPEALDALDATLGAG